MAFLRFNLIPTNYKGRLLKELAEYVSTTHFCGRTETLNSQALKEQSKHVFITRDIIVPKAAMHSAQYNHL